MNRLLNDHLISQKLSEDSKCTICDNPWVDKHMRTFFHMREDGCEFIFFVCERDECHPKHHKEKLEEKFKDK
jgi:hypothetical protein